MLVNGCSDAIGRLFSVTELGWVDFDSDIFTQSGTQWYIAQIKVDPAFLKVDRVIALLYSLRLPISIGPRLCDPASPSPGDVPRVM